MEHVIVVGGGVVGVATALSLRRAGFEVTLIERAELGASCSFGNAGLLSVSGCVPVATPGILRSLPRLLTDANAPLAIRWRYLPKLAPWLLDFVRASTVARVEVASIALAELLAHAHACYRELLGEDAFNVLTRGGGMLYVYESDRSFERAKWAHELRRRRGVELNYVPAEQIRQLEPALAPIFKHAVHVPSTRYVVNPRRLVQTLADRFAAEGGGIVQGEVLDLDSRNGQRPGVHTTSGVRRADRVVVCAGAWSRRLARTAGCDVPLDTERGYHAMVPRPGHAPRIPVMSGDHEFAITPMETGLRFAGTVELGGLSSPPRMERAQLLLRLGRRMCPGVGDANDATFWMGFRPSLPDSLPVIGPVPGSGRVYLAFGHGHLGLTFGAVTARLVTDMIRGAPALVNPEPYAASRFS